MAKQKKVKHAKKPAKAKKDPLKVFDPKRRSDRDKNGKKISRKEQIRRDKLKLAKRYETIRLFDESIKYYKQLGMDEEVKRVTVKKTQLYQAKAHEFEEGGRYSEAAELYERLNMSKKANQMREKGGIVKQPPLGLDDNFIDEDHEQRENPSLQPSRAVRWDMPNVEMDAVGEDELDKDTSSEDDTESQKSYELNEKDIDESMVASVSPDLDWDSEEALKSKQPQPEKDAKSPADSKAFSICPYCGEELKLPKQPKFCPYCREAFE